MKIKFVPQNVECEIKPGQSVLHAAQDAGLYIKSVCKGVPSCAECRVRIVEGDFNVLQPGSAELSLIGTAHFIDRRRLSCQLRCFGDITVDLSEQISKEKKALAKNTRSRAGADELAISRAAASEVSLGAGALREDGASADDLRASGDGLGPDDHGGDDVEGERAAVSAVVGRPVARQPARSAPRPAPRPAGPRPERAAGPASGDATPRAGGGDLPPGEGGTGKRRRRRGRRGGSGGGQGPGGGRG